MVSVLTVGPKICGFKPGRSDCILRAIKTAASVMRLRYVKNHFGRMIRNTLQGQIHFLRPFLLLTIR
jgi:hypothetical protein